LVGLVAGYLLFGPNNVLGFTTTVVIGALVGAVLSAMWVDRILPDWQYRWKRPVQFSFGALFTAISVVFLSDFFYTGRATYVPGIVFGTTGAVYFLYDPTRRAAAMVASGLLAFACAVAFFQTRSLASLIGLIFFGFCALPMGGIMAKKR